MNAKTYWHDGYCFPIKVVTSTEAEQEQQALFKLLARWSGDPTLRPPLIDYCRANFNVVTRWGARLASHPTILDAVETILGPKFVCWMSEVLIKEPQSEKHLSMHQDFTYWGMNDGDKGVTAWLALSPATPENGCMQFVRGSFLKGLVHHEDTFAPNNLLSRGQQITEPYADSDVVYCTLEPGELSLHHSLTFHGSGPNRTNTSRVAAVMRYLSTEIKPLDGSMTYAMPGRGHAPKDRFVLIGEPATDFSEDSLSLHDRVTHSQEKQFAAGSKKTLTYDA